MKRLFLILHIAFACFLLAEAADDARKRIQLAYEKAALGAEYRYIAGMLSNRTDDFQLFTPAGMLVDLDAERERFAKLIEPATRINLQTTIRQFDQDASGKAALCIVYQDFRVEMFDGAAGNTKVLSIKTLAKDWWKLIGGEWRLARTQVIQQTLGPGEALPARKVDPTLFRRNKR